MALRVRRRRVGVRDAVAPVDADAVVDLRGRPGPWRAAAGFAASLTAAAAGAVAAVLRGRPGRRRLRAGLAPLPASAARAASSREASSVSSLRRASICWTVVSTKVATGLFCAGITCAHGVYTAPTSQSARSRAARPHSSHRKGGVRRSRSTRNDRRRVPRDRIRGVAIARPGEPLEPKQSCRAQAPHAWMWAKAEVSPRRRAARLMSGSSWMQHPGTVGRRSDVEGRVGPPASPCTATRRSSLWPRTSKRQARALEFRRAGRSPAMRHCSSWSENGCLG